MPLQEPFEGLDTVWTRREYIQTLTGHTKAVRAAVYSPDSSYIASGGVDTTIMISKP